MTTKSDFTDEEWNRIRRAPFVAGMAISLADPGGPIEMSKETMTTMKSATNPPSREQLLAEVALDIQSMTQQRESPISGFKPQAAQQILDELGAVSEIVSSKATAEEAAAFKQWLLTTAQAAADAAKEGGFMGFGAVQVSEGEQRMLDQVRATIGA
jgi:transcription antitermination factor NusG